MIDLIIIVAILLIPLIAQVNVSSTYSKASYEKNKKELTGFEVARKILDANGLNDLHIVETPGNMTDHYDPNRKVVRLSTHVYHESSIASMAIAAHECGHAIQDKENYTFLRLRSLIYPVVHLGTSISYIIIFLGAIAQMLKLIYLGIALVSLGLVFQLITLPVEFDASKRAKEEIDKLSLAEKKETTSVSNMLKAAAMTYVAGVLSSALEIVRLILAFRDR